MSDSTPNLDDVRRLLREAGIPFHEGYSGPSANWWTATIQDDRFFVFGGSKGVYLDDPQAVVDLMRKPSS